MDEKPRNTKTMNREELYYQSVDTLLDAYNSGGLEHGICSACAVGNLCRAASKTTGLPPDSWSNLFLTAVWRNIPRQSTYESDSEDVRLGALKLIEKEVSQGRLERVYAEVSAR
jgi:hypothetical protein